MRLPKATSVGCTVLCRGRGRPGVGGLCTRAQLAGRPDVGGRTAGMVGGRTGTLLSSRFRCRGIWYIVNTGYRVLHAGWGRLDDRGTAVTLAAVAGHSSIGRLP